MRQERRRMEERTHAHLLCKAQLHIQCVTLFQWHFLWRKVSLSFTHNIYAHTDPVYTHKYTRQQPTRTHKAICHAPTSSARPISCQSHSAIWLVTSGQCPDIGSSCMTLIYALRGLLEGLLHYCLQPWKILILKRVGGRLPLTLTRWWLKICIMIILMETCI